jgi:hypothetical protein
MAQVAAVYTVVPHVKTAESIMKIAPIDEGIKPFKALARNKRVWPVWSVKQKKLSKNHLKRLCNEIQCNSVTE